MAWAVKYVKNIVVATADEEIANANADLKYEVGTMIEIPIACITADAIGLSYVSCSPFRVPIARLAAAQANIKSSK